MPATSFNDLMAGAERGQYAVGYFEAWNMESLLAICDAAMAMRSPVLLGWSGIFLTHPNRSVRDALSLYAVLGGEACNRLTVPACLLFNESPDFEAVSQAIGQGYGLVMYSDETNSYQQQIKHVSDLVAQAHQNKVAVEGEANALAGVGGELQDMPDNLHLTSPETAADFVQRTGVDAFAVNIGQAHLHGRGDLNLDLGLLEDIRKAVSVPLVLHGASSVNQADIRAAIQGGIRKINVGSILKQTYFEAMRAACISVGHNYNPYEVIGSGFPEDVLVVGRQALRDKVEKLMQLFGSSGQAKETA